MEPDLVLHRPRGGEQSRKQSAAPQRGGHWRDPASQEALDRITALTGETLSVSAVFASLVDIDRRLLTSSYGLPVPLALLLSHAFRKHVIASRQPLVIGDGQYDVAVADNPAVHDGTVRACVGIPFDMSDGRPLGSLLAMDHQPRKWTAVDLELLRRAAALIVSEVELGSAMRQSSRHGSATAPASPARSFMERRSATRLGGTNL